VQINCLLKIKIKYMKHLLFVAGLICSLGVQAQLTGISVETYMVHEGISIPELAGFTTYHVYANTTNSEDFVSAVFGDSENAIIFSSAGTVFQSAPSYEYGDDPNPALFSVIPTLEYDSWMSIGMMSSDDEGSISNIGMSDAMEEFSSTGNFYIDDPIGGSWFFPGFPCGETPIVDCANQYAAFGGADNKVLLAQITTDDSFTGVFNVQIFVNGIQEDSNNYNGVGFSSDTSDTFGCTDPNASNYDATATVDDLSCVLPCSLALVVESATSPTCNGDNDGSLNITSTGAQGSDDYYFGIDDETPSNFGIFNDLLAGDYFVQIVDGAGCQASATVTVPATEAVSLSATLTSPISCNDTNDAVITVSNAMGGDGNLEFYLQGAPETSSTEMTFSGLGAGTYTVVATDGNGCSANSVATLVNNPTAIQVFVTNSSPASCFNVTDGQIIVSGFGGAVPASITYSVNGESGLTSPLMVPGGTFTVTGTDINGCSGSSEEVVIGPDAIMVNAMATAVACTDDSNGIVSWAPVGGAGGFTVTVLDSTLTGSSYEGLSAGTYTVLVSDGNGCSTSEMVEVMNAVPVVATATSTSVTCSGSEDGVVSIDATGGTGAFQYSDNGNTFVATNEFDDLAADDYTFYAQDENGCIAEADVEVTSPDPIVIGGFPSEGEDTGNAVIDISVTGGTPDYSYEWTGPGVDGTTTADLEGLSSGTYTVEVTDAAGCSEVATFNVVTGIYELAGGVEAQIFPNPSTGLFQVQWEGWTGGDVAFSVIDARGRQVTQGVWAGAGASFLTTLDLSGVENGLYRLNVVSNGIPTSIQLLKAN
jgi:hypothetical protein